MYPPSLDTAQDVLTSSLVTDGSPNHTSMYTPNQPVLELAVPKGILWDRGLGARLTARRVNQNPP